MSAQSRRKRILEVLRHEKHPISATTLAKQFGVSRQIVVGDIALLRAGGTGISATPKGYLLDRERDGLRKKIVCQHDGDRMREELYVCVDNGCSVLDVIVEHPVYGQLTGQLQLTTRYDVDQFLRMVLQDSAHALSELTDGIHIHTLLCPNEAALQRVRTTLDRKGFLVKSEEN